MATKIDSDTYDVYIVPKQNRDIPFGDDSKSMGIVNDIETISSPKQINVPIMKRKIFLVGGPNGMLEVLSIVKRTTGDLALPNIRQNMIVYADQYISFNMKSFTKLRNDGINIAIPVKRNEDKSLSNVGEALNILYKSLEEIPKTREFLVLNLRDLAGRDIIISSLNVTEIKNKLSEEDRKKRYRIVFVLNNPWGGKSISRGDMKINENILFESTYEENVSLFSNPKPDDSPEKSSASKPVEPKVEPSKPVETKVEASKPVEQKEEPKVEPKVEASKPVEPKE